MSAPPTAGLGLEASLGWLSNSVKLVPPPHKKAGLAAREIFGRLPRTKAQEEVSHAQEIYCSVVG